MIGQALKNLLGPTIFFNPCTTFVLLHVLPQVNWLISSPLHTIVTNVALCDFCCLIPTPHCIFISPLPPLSFSTSPTLKLLKSLSIHRPTPPKQCSAGLPPSLCFIPNHNTSFFLNNPPTFLSPLDPHSEISAQKETPLLGLNNLSIDPRDDLVQIFNQDKPRGLDENFHLAQEEAVDNFHSPSPFSSYCEPHIQPPPNSPSSTNSFISANFEFLVQDSLLEFYHIMNNLAPPSSPISNAQVGAEELISSPFGDKKAQKKRRKG